MVFAAIGQQAFGETDEERVGMADAKGDLEPIDILVSLDEAYLPRLETMLTSLAVSNASDRFRVHILHRSIAPERLERLARGAAFLGCEIASHVVDGALFAEAPVTRRYPQEMYYRLLAASLLPDMDGRLLYLDPDILVINPLRPLWEIDMRGAVFAAAVHEVCPVTKLVESVNKARLDTESDRYFNSGVLLMDMKAARSVVRPEDVFKCVRERGDQFVLPDQDVLNELYGAMISEIDELVWNYDARQYHAYMMSHYGEVDVDWVMRHTAILHFCGRAKPWKRNYSYRFGELYKHYDNLAERFFTHHGAGSV